MESKETFPVGKDRKGNILRVARYATLIVYIGVITYLVIRYSPTSIQSLVAYAGSRPYLTALIFMGLFLLKSISFGLPFALLYVTVGSIYPLWIALIINVCGVLVNLQIPYVVGRYAGRGFVEKLTGKFPKLEKLEQLSGSSGFLFSMMIKFMGKIPHEITNLFLGSLHISYTSYVCGGVVGLAPTMIVTTIMGNNVDQIDSPQFLISAAAFIALLVCSYIFYKRFSKSSS